MNIYLKLPEAFSAQNKMHHITFGGRAPPTPAGRAYIASPDTLAGLSGSLLQREGVWKGSVGEERGREGKGTGRGLPTFMHPRYAPNQMHAFL